MYGCESWTIKKAEHRRIDAFELWCWRRFLRVPWTTRTCNQSILKEILKLKLQYFGKLMQWAHSLEKTLMLGNIEGRRRRGKEKRRWLDSVTDSMDIGLSELWETVKDREAWCAAIHEVTKSRTWQNSWTTETSDPSRVDTQTQTNPSNGQLVPNHSLFHESYHWQGLYLAGPVKNTLIWAAGHLINREQKEVETVKAERRTCSL